MMGKKISEKKFNYNNLIFSNIQNTEMKADRTTAVSQDLGFRLNLKLVLYLENLRLTEK